MKIGNKLWFYILLLVGILFIYLSFKKLEIKNIISIIKAGNYWAVIPVFIVSIFGYYIRTLRWKMLLNSMDAAPKTKHLFAALSIGYAVNFATPRLGEIARCMVLKKTNNTAINQSIMTIVIERIIDVCCLLVLIFLTAYFNIAESASFIQHNLIIPVKSAIQNINWLFLIMVVAAGGFIFYLLYLRFKNSTRIKQWILRFYLHIKQLAQLPEKGIFGMYTFLIWLCYFMMTFLWFTIFAETATLGMKDAFIIMVVGSIGRSIPIQGGGMGAYHYLVSNAFTLFGVSLSLGYAMAIVIHGAQLLLTFALGLISWFWILIHEKSKNENNSIAH